MLQSTNMNKESKIGWGILIALGVSTVVAPWFGQKVEPYTIGIMATVALVFFLADIVKKK